MSDANEDLTAARRLRELFKGRFDQQTAVQLLKDFGGELQAVDFILNENEEVVQKHLKQSPSYLRSLTADAKRVDEILENGIEFSVRQFACGQCQRSWWKKVPIRKEVSKCWRCKSKYEPIPKEAEWGWGRFVCVCGNEFHGFGEMCVTTSNCYTCHVNVLIESVLPPRRRIGQRKTRAPHSCNGINCHNRCDGPTQNQNIFMGSYGSTHYGRGGTQNQVLINAGPNVVPNGHARGRGSARRGPARSVGPTVGPGTGPGAPGAYPNQDAEPVCCHPKSARPTTGQHIRTTSKKHTSTGSSVTTFLSQGSLDVRSDAVPRIPPTIPE